MSIHEIEPQLNGHGLRIGVVQSRFNEPICEGLRSGCLAGLRQMQVQNTDITYITVPGALEIPLALQTMAQSGHFDALIALGAVIRGETYHFEIVSNESARGIMDVQLATGVPIANAVLTTENDDQALVRMMQKGKEAAEAAIEMARLVQTISKR
ncbi:MAG: 6,7-dimethyl-8-ribityllumazine synthase [Rhodocyclales bacterium]|nr:6,7-dimethyl-8-ribityllumazine synthase [Rhodocyclales bacterium]